MSEDGAALPLDADKVEYATLRNERSGTDGEEHRMMKRGVG